MNSGFQVLDCGFYPCGFLKKKFSEWIPDSFFSRILDSNAPDSTSANFLNSGILISLHGAAVRYYSMERVYGQVQFDFNH